MPYPIYHIDAFAEQPFTGNPAVVVLLDSQERETEWMQSLAAEMNLSETAFVRKLDDERFELRWFTPRYEVELCGHATLAAAHAMKQAGLVESSDTIRFVTRSGELPVRSTGEEICLNFPLTPPQACDPPDGMLSCFRVAAAAISPSFVGPIALIIVSCYRKRRTCVTWKLTLRNWSTSIAAV